MLNNKFICDTNVLLSSILSKNSPPYQAVNYIENNGLFVFSQETFSELVEVLNREKFDKYISRQTRDVFIQQMYSNSLIYEVYQKVNICRDPKDNKFLDVAISSYANCLITGDEDLLILEYIGNTSIITPREFVESYCL